MKKTLFTLIFSLAAVAAGAQTMYDGLTFSQNNYYGTARSIAMGNAMTAVGGDLGSVGLNPAGSAVAGYSQFTITPNLTIGASTASYSAYPVNGSDVFANPTKNSLTRFTMPNIGFSLDFKTGRSSGLKSISYGFIVNGTNTFADKMMGGGQNDKTSYLSYMAVAAEGYDVDFLNGYRNASGQDIDEWDHAYYNADDRGYYAPWNIIANAQAGAISVFGDPAEPAYYYRYVGATELFSATDEYDSEGNRIYNIALGGPVDQTYGRQVKGGKQDYLFNLAFNFSDKFYVGANLGITSLGYEYDEYFKEFASDPNDFPINLTDNNGNPYTVYFDNYRSRYSYTANGTGVYGKIGFIAKPTTGLRLGAAIQTPTAFSINEIWQHAVDVHYTGSGAQDGEATTPEGNYEYNFRTPYRVNAGLAYTFLGMGLISADYEMTDYSKMKFKETTGSEGTFTSLNSDIMDCMGISHMVRIGAEFKPSPEIAIRAGYNFATTPEYSWVNNVKTTTNDNINSFSVGLGYSSNGSFFADLAGRMTTFADEFISPYADYLDYVSSPLLLNKRERYDITLTLGWRF